MEHKVSGKSDVQLLTIREACDRLRMGRTMIYAMMDSGELAYVRIGRTRRIRLTTLEALVELNTVAGRA